MDKIVSRVSKQQTLNDISKSKQAEFLAIYGRRRVGKTFLVRNLFITKEWDIAKIVSIALNGFMKRAAKELCKL